MLNSFGVPGETPIERIGRLAVQLLDAARDQGDAGLILAAERAALEAGRVIARHLNERDGEAPAA